MKIADIQLTWLENRGNRLRGMLAFLNAAVLEAAKGNAQNPHPQTDPCEHHALNEEKMSNYKSEFGRGND
ncbi:hypothetical protein Y032_0020g237 [Ancylostoma ceylanicum]|uniref:Uncharacterized protein n=1 Tax=Ancylostoma ceylanicum TaxID=53326 RepID=A0A016V1L3_9BILA|nr:hypothetical protein Y032_0020g237 [Ancylostoma ceylanicum]